MVLLDVRSSNMIRETLKALVAFAVLVIAPSLFWFL
jgi:hypothetical protein